jgi:two-component system NarL family sensor kinase
VDVTRRLAELETLNAIGEVLNREPTFDVALQVSLDRLVELVGVSTGWVFLATLEHGDPHHSRFRLAATAGLPAALSDASCHRLRDGSCECMGRFRRRELDAGTNLVTCSRIEGAIADHGDCDGLRIHASVPLQGQAAPIGILNLASPGVERFDDETLTLLTAVGRQLGIAYERARYLQQRQREAQHVAALEERSRVARDIHDSVTQLLFGAHLALDVARSDAGSAASDDAVGRAAGLVASGLDELRGLVELLRSADLEQGLYPALVRLRGRLTGDVDVHLDGEEVACDDGVAEQLYRVVQEAVHNALKHADAANVWIRLRADDGIVTLAVEDDGHGFPATLTRGVGLDSIADRVASVDGTLVLGDRDGDGGGASVRVEVRCRPGS